MNLEKFKFPATSDPQFFTKLAERDREVLAQLMKLADKKSTTPAQREAIYYAHAHTETAMEARAEHVEREARNANPI